MRRGGDGDAKAIRHLHEMLLVPEDRRVSVRDDETGEYVTRRAGDVCSPEERFVEADDHTVLMHANESIAERLNEGMADGPACVHDRAFAGESVTPGKLRFGIRPASLAGVCYLSVALALTEHRPRSASVPTRRAGGRSSSGTGGSGSATGPAATGFGSSGSRTSTGSRRCRRRRATDDNATGAR